MASNSSKNPILPVSEPARGDEGEKERLLKGDEKLFRGSAMTRRGANAAISYMACAGINFISFLLFNFFLYYCFDFEIMHLGFYLLNLGLTEEIFNLAAC